MKKPFKAECSPAIWKKFDKTEKQIWSVFYERCLFEAEALKGAKGFTLTDANCHTIAHNMACEVTWSLIGALPLKKK